MTYRKFASATLTAAVLASVGVAQTNEELQRQLNEQKAQIEALTKSLTAVKAENSDLTATAKQEAVETEVNRLAERLAAGTTLKSEANQITMNGEFRYRGSWTLGDTLATTDEEHDGYFNSSRVRLGFRYDFTKNVSAYAQLQTDWAFGDGSATEAGSASNTVNLYEARVEMRNLFDRPELSATVGRQEITLGHQFQFGNADWFNGITFDGSRYDWNSESFSLTAMVLKLTSNDGDINQVSSFRGSHDDDELYSLYFTLKSIKNVAIDLYWIYLNGHNGGALNSGVNGGAGFLFPGSTAYYHTFGARIGGTLDVAAGLDFNLEGAYETGDSHSPAQDVDSFAIEGELGITFNKDNKFRIFVRGLYAEGADNSDTGYLPLYPNRHSNTASFRARYGAFDLIPMTNVATLQLGLHFDPNASWTIGATGLWATTDNEIVTGPGLDDDYGWEVDVWAEYRYSQHLTFGAGIAFLFADDQGEALWNVDDDTQFLGYVQARLFF